MDYTALFKEIDSLKSKLDSKRPLTAGEVERLRSEFIIDFTYNSNAIEGNTLTLKETAMALEGITIDKKPLKDHLEAVGHRDAFLYIGEIAEKKQELSEYIIKQIHSLVLMHRPEDKGTYRRIPVRIMGAVHEPSEPYLIETLMNELIDKNNVNMKKMHIAERIAWFHLEFEGIHPFIDGNGRTGRLIMNLDLIQNGLPPINVKFQDRMRYYDAFTTYHKDNSISGMVELVGEYLIERLNQYIDFL